MKLSTVKKFGYIHVRGGKLLRVVHEHPVDTKGFCIVAREQKQGFEPVRNPPPQVMARAGDLAIEIVTRRAGTVLGYSYLSGDAIQINSYQVRPDRYAAAVLTLAHLTPPTAEEAASETGFETFIEGMRRSCVEMKLSTDVDVWVFDGKCDDKASGANIADTIQTFWRLVPKDMTDDEVTKRARAHFLGSVHAGKGRGSAHYFMHFQPPCDASDYAATPFQAALCMTSLEERPRA